MREVLRTNDMVLISAVESLLRAAGFAPFIADAHIAAVEGSIGILPRRILVPDEDYDRARRLLKEAGFADALKDA